MPQLTHRAPYLSFLTEEGVYAWQILLRYPTRAVILLDGDGTMWYLVRFPDMPVVDPRFPVLLRGLQRRTLATGLLTGRSVEQVESFGLTGIDVVGQFGCECKRGDRHDMWEPLPTVPADARVQQIRQLLAELGLSGLDRNIEVKSHFVAVHYPGDLEREVLGQLHGGLERLAREWRLAFLPGRNVIEIGPRVDKKDSLLKFVNGLERGVSVVLYAGDSAPDLGAFDALDLLRAKGIPTIKVAASDHEELCARADIWINGPEGLLMMLTLLQADPAPGDRRLVLA